MCCGLVATAAAQTPILVTSLTDGNAGALRAALAAAASAPPPVTIELRIAGTYTLDTNRGSLPAVPAGTTIRPFNFAPGARFVVDARNFSVGLTGLRLPGAGARITAPLSVLLNNGSGVLVTGNDVALTDIEVEGGTAFGFRAENVSNLQVDRLAVRRANVGVSLRSCRNSRIGQAASGAAIQVSNSTAQGLLLQFCTDVAVEHFRVDDNNSSPPTPALLMQDNTRVSVGATTRRSSLSRNASGAKLERCVDCRLTGVDVLQSGQVAVWIDAGSDNTISHALVDRPGQIGVQLGNGTVRAVVGPSVIVTEPANGLGPCVATNNCTNARLVGIEAQRGSPGISAGQNTVDAVVEDCNLHHNYRGLHASRTTRLSVVRSRCDDNSLRGIELDAAVDTTVADSFLQRNAGPGFEAVNGSHRVVFGPGNTVTDNGFIGVSLRDCNDCRISGNPALRDNRGAGVELARSHRAVIADNVVTGNLGNGMWLLFDSNRATIGPGNLVQANLGNGIKIELCNDGLVVGNRLLDNLGSGVVIIEQASAANLGHRVLSTLIAGNRDLGITMRSTVPLFVDACTITDNYRGIDATATGLPPAIRIDSCILWNNWLDDYNPTTGVIASVNRSIVQRPPGTGNNSALDPRFVAAATGDFRLRADSPALNAANQARYRTLGIGARDCLGRDRFVDCAMDQGACEFQRITATQRPGPIADVALEWPPSSAGDLAVLVFSTAPPAGGFAPCSTFSWDAFTLQQFGPAALANVPAGGIVRFSQPLLVSSPVEVWAAGFRLDRQGTLAGSTGTVPLRLP